MTERGELSLRRRLIRSLVRRASRRYFVGERLDDAVTAHQKVEQRGFESTLAYWDGSDEGVKDVVDIYLETIRAIERIQAKSYLSIKPWVFGYRRGEFRKVVAKAAESRVGIHMDSLKWEWVDKSLALLEDSELVSSQIGCTLPARWQRSADDAVRVAKLGCPVRIVKGQHPDPENPERDSVQGFLSLVRFFAEHRHGVRVASHDPVVVSQALPLLRNLDVPVELELLYGLPFRQVLSIANSLGVKTRIYIPFGRGFLPYSVGALRRRPGIAWWLLKDLLLPGDRLVSAGMPSERGLLGLRHRRAQILPLKSNPKR